MFYRACTDSHVCDAARLTSGRARQEQRMTEGYESALVRNVTSGKVMGVLIAGLITAGLIIAGLSRTGISPISHFRLKVENSPSISDGSFPDLSLDHIHRHLFRYPCNEGCS